MSDAAPLYFVGRARSAGLFIAALIVLSVFADLLIGPDPVLLRANDRVYLLPALSAPALVADPTLPWQWAIGPLISTAGGGSGPIDKLLAVISWWVFATRHVVWVTAFVLASAWVLGTVLGALSALGPPLFGAAFARLVEVACALPSLVLVGLLRVSDLSHGSLDIALVLLVVTSVEVGHLVRAIVLDAQRSDFILAARALGASPTHIFRVHLLPLIMRPVAAIAATTAAAVVSIEAALGLVGLGSSEVPSWGNTLGRTDGASPFHLPFWLSLLSVVVTTLALHVLARHVRMDRWVQRSYM